MGLLEEVFNSREFDIEDSVIIKFDDYFDERCREYNSFALDNVDIPILQHLVQLLSDNDCKIEIYVCTYGYAFENSQGVKLTYADCIWLDTTLTLSDVKKIILESKVPEPSDISFIGDCMEAERKKVWLVKQSIDGTPQVIEMCNQNHINKMLQLYWD